MSLSKSLARSLASYTKCAHTELTRIFMSWGSWWWSLYRMWWCHHCRLRVLKHKIARYLNDSACTRDSLMPYSRMRFLSQCLSFLTSLSWLIVATGLMQSSDRCKIKFSMLSLRMVLWMYVITQSTNNSQVKSNSSSLTTLKLWRMQLIRPLRSTRSQSI